MSDEFEHPSLQDLVQRIINSGRTSQQFVDTLDVLRTGIERGGINPNISCYEHKTRWFEMARRFYVQNDYRVPIEGAELGMHEANCKAPTCKRLLKEYFSLTETTEDDSPQISTFLDDLEKELVAGKVREDLIGTYSGVIDSDTDERLPIVQAVDISHHCILEDGYEGVLTYTKPQKGIRVNIEVRQNDRVATHIAFFLGSSLLQPEGEVFIASADRLGIDSHILFDIVNANAPKNSEDSSSPRSS